MSLNFYKDAAIGFTNTAKKFAGMPLEWIKNGVNKGISFIMGTTRSAASKLLKGTVNIGTSIPWIPSIH